ncbi:hypothetical protein ABW20_dc0107377 [Dactylellina cionopaga]|nr:hypothetical protein ABW20_dc0107377 [Dactylellina cionopaga]
MSRMEGLTYGRPMSAAARAAALRAKMAGADIKLPSSSLRSPSSGRPTYFVALDKLESTTEKWLESIEQLKEAALKQQKRLRPEDPSSSDERVHKTPIYKLAARKKLAEDVMMKEASCIADNDSGKSVGSNERIRPSTPTNFLKPAQQPPRPVSEASNPIGPVSPPARKLDELDIQSQRHNITDVMKPTSSAAPQMLSLSLEANMNFNAQDSIPTVRLFRPPATAHTSIAALPPTPPTLMTPAVTPGETNSMKEPVLTATPASIVAPTSLPIPLPTPPSDSSMNIDTSVKSVDALSTSSAKKRRLSSKTILESLIEKKARNPIWYDGAIQKVFHDLVFEMSQQIQSMKREGRIVMFAKDQACRTLLTDLDNMLQKSLRTVEISSFLFLKGKPDLNQVEILKTDLQGAQKNIDEFKKSGWTMGSGDEDSDSDNDDDDGSE